MYTLLETVMCGNPVQLFLKSDHPKYLRVTLKDVTILLAADWLELEIQNNGCLNIPATQEMIRLRENATILNSDYIATTIEDTASRAFGDLKALGVAIDLDIIEKSIMP